MTKHNYVSCSKSAVPAGVRFDTMRSDAGQMIEVQYGDFGTAEHGPGAAYQRVIDHSRGGETAYYTLVADEAIERIEANRARNLAWLATYDALAE
jgi:hypothetical protein